MKKSIVSSFALAFMTATIAMSAAPAQAQTPSRIKQFKDWGAYKYKGTNGTVCYVLSIPKVKLPADRDHGDVYFLVSRKTSSGVTYEPQVEVGYPFKDQSQVTVSIGKKNFKMFTKGNNAWMSNAADEPELVKAMRGGSEMTVKGQSRRGTETSYNYSLKGVSAALKEITSCK